MKVDRFYLEINSFQNLKQVECPNLNLTLEKVNPPNIEINKFFYKNIGKKHNWVDRLIWKDHQWIDYLSNKSVKTYILKKKKDLVGFFELIFHFDISRYKFLLFCLKHILSIELLSIPIGQSIYDFFLCFCKKIYLTES